MTPSHAPAPLAPAPDQTERVILRTAEEEGGLACPCDLLVLGDETGALTAAALDALEDQDEARVFSWTPSHATARALAERFAAPLAAGRLVLPLAGAPAAEVDAADRAAAPPLPLEDFLGDADAHLALARLPKSLGALEDMARRLALAGARSGRTDLTLVAGGRVKHMTRSQNEVLAGVFAEVRGSRGLGKSRALVGQGLRTPASSAGGTGPGGVTTPAARGGAPGTADPSAEGSVRVDVRGESRELALRAVGGTFGGARADAGSLLLLSALDAALTAGEVTAGDGAVTTAIDLGCGNGLLTAYLAAALPEAQVLGSDDDAGAVASTRATLAASGLTRDAVRVTWDDSLDAEPDSSADLVLLNPPFHDGTAVDATLVQGLLDAAARVLRPGGQLWFVHNSHLRYRPELEARFTGVRERARDRRFTVLSARR